MSQRDYADRSTIDKLGIKPGQRIVVVEQSFAVDRELLESVAARVGPIPAQDDGLFDVVLITVDAKSDTGSLLRTWRDRIQSNGAIWLLSRKRHLAGYVSQNELIAAGAQANVVDNKTCSVSPSTSAIRFVIRRRDRPLDWDAR